jgi:hypothetical protein
MWPEKQDDASRGLPAWMDLFGVTTVLADRQDNVSPGMPTRTEFSGEQQASTRWLNAGETTVGVSPVAMFIGLALLA